VSIKTVVVKETKTVKFTGGCGGATATAVLTVTP
jgi:hypothetical protein